MADNNIHHMDTPGEPWQPNASNQWQHPAINQWQQLPGVSWQQELGNQWSTVGSGSQVTSAADWPVDPLNQGIIGTGWQQPTDTSVAAVSPEAKWEDLSEDEEDAEDMATTESTDCGQAAVAMSEFYASPVSASEYQQQTREYTKAAVEALIQSPEYQSRVTRCRLCWKVWCEGQFTQGCLECGDFAMERPCPVCRGKCGQLWKRDVEMSHSHSEAYWNGECGLPMEERQGYLAEMLMSQESFTEDAENAMLDGLTDLKTS